MTAPLAAPYAGVRTEGFSPEPEEMLMIVGSRPFSRKGCAARDARTTASRSTARLSSQAFSSSPTAPAVALFTSTSMPPNAAAALGM